MSGWDAKAVERAQNKSGKPTSQRTALSPANSPPAPIEAPTSEINPLSESRTLTAQNAACIGSPAYQVGHGASGEQEIVFAGRIPGNNGPGGLLRMHWTKRQSLGGLYGWKVRAAQLVPMAGPVRLELVRYSVGRALDFDNLVSTGKLPIDALVRCGILPDDNPTVIAERTYTQERAASQAEQRTVIRLIPLNIHAVR